MGDFPAASYLLSSDGALYDSDRLRVDAQPVPIKFSTYGLVGEQHTLFRDFPHARDIIDKSKDPAFRDRCEETLLILFKVLYDALMEFCALHDIEVCYLGLTIPVQWTLDFEDLYMEAVYKVFTQWDKEEARSRTYFLSEPEALASFAFDLKELAPRLEGVRFALLYDAGGHTFVSIMMIAFAVKTTFNTNIFTN